MTRDEVEQKILKHALSIEKLIREYAPDDDYFHMAFVGGNIHFNNSGSFEKDRDQSQTIDFVYLGKERR